MKRKTKRWLRIRVQTFAPRYRLPNVNGGTFFCAMYDGRMVDLNDF